MMGLVKSSLGQNLVPNPSFEQYTNCPDVSGGGNGITEANGWLSFTDSPDYFNACADVLSGVNVPYTALGYQQAYEGSAFAGAIFCASSTSPPPNVREYFGTQLSQTLVVGQKYYVSFFASLPNNIPYNCWSNKLGAKFTTYNYSGVEGDPFLMTNTSQIHTDSLLKDTTNWVQIKGSFVADSAYQYIIIGNFYDDSNTDTSNCSGAYSYAFIDMVCVSTDSILCSSPTYVASSDALQEMNIYPNPATTQLNIDFNNINKPYQVIVYDSYGQVVLKNQEISVSHSTIDITDLPKGILLLQILFKNQLFYYKLIKQ
jgi:hypothetical protein